VITDNITGGKEKRAHISGLRRREGGEPKVTKGKTFFGRTRWRQSPNVQKVAAEIMGGEREKRRGVF